MSKIIEVYEKYKIIPFLVMHQVRVAAVAEMICDSLSIDIDKENIVQACALHDMGNIVKFNLNHFKEHFEYEGLEYWRKVQEDFILKYGDSDHKANLAIAKELDASERVRDLINHIDASLIEEIISTEDFGKKICAYADGRVSPHGVLSVEQRSLDAIKRYKDHPHTFSEEDRCLFVKKMSEVEKQIFSLSNIKPEDINDESIAEYIEKIKKIEI